MQGKKAIVLGRSKIVVSLEKDFALRRFDLSVFDMKGILGPFIRAKISRGLNRPRLK